LKHKKVAASDFVLKYIKIFFIFFIESLYLVLIYKIKPIDGLEVNIQVLMGINKELSRNQKIMRNFG
jgi:hypothetical protein